MFCTCIPLLCFACSIYCADHDVSETDGCHSLLRMEEKENTLKSRLSRFKRKIPTSETCGGQKTCKLARSLVKAAGFLRSACRIHHKQALLIWTRVEKKQLRQMIWSRTSRWSAGQSWSRHLRQELDLYFGHLALIWRWTSEDWGRWEAYEYTIVHQAPPSNSRPVRILLRDVF